MSSRGFTLHDLHLDQKPDPTRLWSPVELSPLTYLPSYPELSPAAQIRYNQLFACGVCEQFIWFENDLLKPVLKRTILDLAPELEFSKQLQEFVLDEEKHAEMFWRLLHHAEPAHYPTRKYRLLNLGLTQKISLFVMTRFSRSLLVWIWAALFFEERTLDYSRRYFSAKKRDSSALDENFSHVHLLHLKDEARHHQLDQKILHLIYDNAPQWKRKIAGLMMYQLMRAFASPKRVSRKVLKILREEFPNEASILNQLETELPLLASNEAFHQIAFGSQSVGTSRKLLTLYPEMERTLELFHSK